MQLANMTLDDLDSVLALNEASIPHVNSLNVDELRWFVDHAHYFRVARVDNEIGGFLIGLRPGLRYASPNYRWFCGHYDDFGYIDRVAVASNARRRGVASSLYGDFIRTLQGQVAVLTCEVNIRPPNEGSMHFHTGFGFRQVGTQTTESGRKKVALLEKTL